MHIEHSKAIETANIEQPQAKETIKLMLWRNASWVFNLLWDNCPNWTLGSSEDQIVTRFSWPAGSVHQQRWKQHLIYQGNNKGSNFIWMIVLTTGWITWKLNLPFFLDKGVWGVKKIERWRRWLPLSVSWSWSFFPFWFHRHSRHFEFQSLSEVKMGKGSVYL